MSDHVINGSCDRNRNNKYNFVLLFHYFCVRFKGLLSSLVAVALPKLVAVALPGTYIKVYCFKVCSKHFQLQGQ